MKPDPMHRGTACPHCLHALDDEGGCQWCGHGKPAPTHRVTHIKTGDRLSKGAETLKEHRARLARDRFTPLSEAEERKLFPEEFE